MFIESIIHIGPQRHHDMRDIPIRGKSENIWTKLFNDKKKKKAPIINNLMRIRT